MIRGFIISWLIRLYLYNNFIKMYFVVDYKVGTDEIINLNHIEDVKSYDFSVNYSEKLNFEATF